MPRKTQEQFEKDVYERLGEDYVLLGPYPGCHGKVLMQHKICGNEFLKNVHDIISKKSGCPYCFGNRPAQYNEQWVIEHCEKPYSYVNGYTSMKEKALFHCDICKKDFYQTPRKIIIEKLYGCGCCPTKKKTHKDFLQELGDECLQEYEVLEEYINADTPLSFLHKPCQSQFKLSPYKFIHRNNKKYCPVCYWKKSMGEISIVSFLEQEKISYIKEHKFTGLPDCFFDFYIPQENIVIEFDGEQHFKFISFFHKTEENFIKRQNKDKEKNKYCIDNNIILFRIPYWELDNINLILTQILKEKSSTTIEKFQVK